MTLGVIVAFHIMLRSSFGNLGNKVNVVANGSGETNSWSVASIFLTEVSMESAGASRCELLAARLFDVDLVFVCLLVVVSVK